MPPSCYACWQAMASPPSENPKVAQRFLDGIASLGRAGVDAAGVAPVMSGSELEAAQFLDVRDPTCSGTETVVRINPGANIAVGDWMRGGASTRV